MNRLGEEPRATYSRGMQAKQHEAAHEMAENRNLHGVEQAVAEYAVKEINEKQVLGFLRRMLNCSDFCKNIPIRKGSISFLAAKSLAGEENNKAVYFLLCYALSIEILSRGPDGLKTTFAAGSTLQHLCSNCGMLDRIIKESCSRSKMIKFLHEACGESHGDAEVRKNLHDRLLLLEKEKVPGKEDLLFHPFVGAYSGAERYLSSVLKITVVSLADEHICFGFYDDTAVGWLVERTTRHFASHKKKLQVVHKGRSLCHNNVSYKTLADMGIRHGDKVEIESSCSLDNNPSCDPSIKAANPGKLVSELATEKISEERVLDFLRRIVNHWDTHKGFQRDECYSSMFNDIVTYEILTANFFLEGENDQAVYMMLCAALAREVTLRGPKCLKEIVETNSTLQHVCQHCLMVDRVVESHTRSSMIEMISRNLNANQEEKKLHKLISALQEKEIPELANLQLHQIMSALQKKAGISEFETSSVDGI